MNNQFDELTRSLAQSVKRRAALKQFGVGLAGMVLAAFGLANKSEAAPNSTNKIPNWCDRSTNPCCCKHCKTWLPTSDLLYGACAAACGAIIGVHCP